MGPEQKSQRKMSVWAVAGLWGRIGWFPDLVYMKITRDEDKDLIISAVPAGPCFPKSRYLIMQASNVLGIAQTSRCGSSATALLLAPLSLSAVISGQDFTRDQNLVSY
jgi:hypothetical protein